MKFRKQALRQLEAPEQLDESVRLATVPGWLATAVIVVVVSAAGIWAATATIPRTITGVGVLTHSAGVSRLDATVAGRITRVWATPEQRVSRGDPLYTLQDDTGTLRTEASPYDAYVVNWLVRDGQVVQLGDRVADMERLDTPGDELLARVYVPAAVAPSLQPGIQVEVQPDAVSTAVFGSLHGVVVAVGSFAETEQSLHAFLGEGRDVRDFLAAGSVVGVSVRLDPDPQSPTGLRWSKAGPPFRLTSQSQLAARFTVSRERPLSWLVNG